MNPIVLFKGAGEMASGAARRLRMAGFRVVMTELAQPLCVRRQVSFAECIYAGKTTVENVTAVSVSTIAEIESAWMQGAIAVSVDPECNLLRVLLPSVVIDARLAKRNLGTKLSDAELVIGLGPGFTAGRDVHAVVETNRGHNLGRVFYGGPAEDNTGEPAPVCGVTHQRVLRAPIDGTWSGQKRIGDAVSAGEIVGDVSGIRVAAETAGVLRGIAHNGLHVTAGCKVGDIDPRNDADCCFTISDKANAIAGGVMEAVFHHFQRQS